jgi:AraC family transcriptional activator of pobA
MPTRQAIAETLPTTAPRRGLAKLPAFALYGEARSLDSVLLHIESIHQRSRLYDWEIDAHVHQGLHQVLWLRQGRVEAILDESRTSNEGPVALAIPPGVAHAFRFSQGCDGFVLTFKASLLAEGDQEGAGEALQTLFASPRCLPLPSADAHAQRLQHLLEALHAESQAAEDSSSPVPRWLTRALVWNLARLAHRQDNFTGQPRAAGRQSLYTRWVVLLEAHYRDHWPVSRYAQRLGLSTERLNRMVQAETGQNAQALLHARLAREACRHLLHLAAPVSKIAFELGFEDPAYFCRFFKRHAGCSPRAYRSQAQLPVTG